MTQTSFLAAKQVKAGMEELPTTLAQAKASAAEPPEKVTAERATRETNKGHLSDNLSLSACKCNSRASNTFLLELDSSSSICRGHYSLLQYDSHVHQLCMGRGQSKGTCITYQEQTSCLQATLPLSTARAGPATLTRYDDTFAS